MVTAGPAAHAQAAACNNDFQGGRNGGGTINVVSPGNYRVGPAEGYCALTPRTGTAFAYCKTFNKSAGNLWYLARDSSSSQIGWIWAGHVSSTSGNVINC